MCYHPVNMGPVVDVEKSERWGRGAGYLGADFGSEMNSKLFFLEHWTVFGSISPRLIPADHCHKRDIASDYHCIIKLYRSLQICYHQKSLLWAQSLFCDSLSVKMYLICAIKEIFKEKGTKWLTTASLPWSRTRVWSPFITPFRRDQLWYSVHCTDVSALLKNASKFYWLTGQGIAIELRFLATIQYFLARMPTVWSALLQTFTDQIGSLTPFFT